MKPIMNVAMAMLLSFGIVACSGGGSSNGEKHSAPHHATQPDQHVAPKQNTPPKKNGKQAEKPSAPSTTPPKRNEQPQADQAAEQPRDNGQIDLQSIKDPNHVNANDPNKETIVLEAGGSKKNYAGKYGVVTVERETKSFVEIGASPNSDFYTDVSHIPLDATYFGTVFIGDADKDNEVERRSVLFTLQDKQISGHSIKTTQNDVQVIFEKTKTGRQKILNKDVLGFQGKIDVKKNQQDFGTGNYKGYFAGNTEQPAQEVIGDFQSEVIFGSFLAEKQTSPATPSQP